jgi:hypothetical protein
MVDERRKQLMERVSASRYISKSARLRDLLQYLCDRVLDQGAEQIHEQEVGHHVFGRPPDYDTAADNIVRVHASTLRKRLEQYFAEEGAAEPLILEIPKGNYAPVFRSRQETEAVSPSATPEPAPAVRHPDRRVPILGAVAAIFALSTLALLIRDGTRPAPETTTIGPTVRLFWSEVFRGNQGADIVMDDAGVGLYQELSGQSLALSDYFDRSYLRSVPATGGALVLRRQSSYANVGFLWKVFQLAAAESQQVTVLFARDYSFHGLKTHNAVLLGNPQSNPWIQPFLAHLGLRWTFEKSTGTYYPVDTWAVGGPASFRAGDSETREGYCGISLLPNLGGSGNVLIVSATGGSALNAAASFLADEAAMANLHTRLPAAKGSGFPYFEALVRVKGRSTLPKDGEVVICRTSKS